MWKCSISVLLLVNPDALLPSSSACYFILEVIMLSIPVRAAVGYRRTVFPVLGMASTALTCCVSPPFVLWVQAGRLCFQPAEILPVILLQSRLMSVSCGPSSAALLLQNYISHVYRSHG